MEMSVVKEEGDIVHISLSGRLDLNGVNQIENNFKQKVAESPNLFVDMQNVSFLASLGMRMLMMAAKTMKGKAGKIILISPQEEVENALRMSGLDQVIPIVESLEEATQEI